MSTGLPHGASPLSAAQALAIAQADALRAYRDLTPYRVQVVLEADGWHVDYSLKDAQRKGGGPHYVVAPSTGEILAKRYEQ